MWPRAWSRSSAPDSYGKELIIELCKAGDFFGHMDVLKGFEYGSAAEVFEDAEVHLIPRKNFLDLMHRNRDVAMRFIRLLAGEVTQNQERLLALAYASVGERTAQACSTCRPASRRPTTAPAQPRGSRRHGGHRQGEPDPGPQRLQIRRVGDP